MSPSEVCKASISGHWRDRLLAGHNFRIWQLHHIEVNECMLSIFLNIRVTSLDCAGRVVCTTGTAR